MKFHKKHPYLFWELIGLAVLFIDFLLIVCFFGLLDLKGDAVYATIVFTAIFAGFIILLSPAIIFIRHRKSASSIRYYNFADAIIFEKKSDVLKAVLVFIISLLVFIAVAGFMCYTGFVIFIPLAIYAAAAVYIPWKKYTLSKFYKVKNAEKYCELICADDSDFLDRLDKEYTLTVFNIGNKPDAELLNFLYNAMNFKGFIKDNKLRIYILDNAFISKTYSFKTEPNLSLLCILPDDLNLSDKNELSKLFNYRTSALFDKYEAVIHILIEEYIECINYNEYLK